ncbi:hypothetical protein SCUCBS95973_008578 [Sporothrix curviconia]|uniref:RNA polymerase II holoenzyme cyclin-like subunit n=1 Tax=Sporothrix curviconia TaxID=1260050 RepID=A0ABP0CQU5_9PEZI
MASLDRYRPNREAYQPPAVPQPPKQSSSSSSAASASAAPQSAPGTVPPAPSIPPSAMDRHLQSQSQYIPPAVPSPPTHSSRTSPPLRPRSRRSASPQKQPPSHPLSQSFQQSSQQPLQQSSQQPPHQPSSQQQHKPASNQPPFANQWFFSDDELVSTPSVLQGLSPAEERERRSKGVNFIYQSGIAVRPHPLPQVTLYVAAIFFHRFYMRTSMLEERGGIHHYKIAATAMFLANKTEENCFKTKNIIIAVAKVAQKNMDLVVDEQSKEYWRWRDVILTYEELMLETLTFDLVVANPYDQLFVQLRKLGQLGTKPVREAAWSFLNDSALTTLPLALDASDLASASIFFASVATRITLDDVKGRPWWQHVRADEARITRASRAMAAFYTDNPLKKQQAIGGRLAQVSSPVFQLEATRRPQELAQINSRFLDTGASGSGGGAPPISSNNGRPVSRDMTPLELDQRQPSQSQSQTQLQSTAATSVPDGDSDAALKAAANDLDHHHHYSNGNGNGNGDSYANGNGSRKRKSAEPDNNSNGNSNSNDRSDGIEEGEYDGSSASPPAKRARRTSEGEIEE